MSPEPFGVDDGALRGFGADLVIAASDIPAAPAGFTVTGADAISQRISGLLPTIEGPILSGLPQVKEEATVTANGIVESAEAYQRTDEEIAARIRELLGLVDPSERESGPGGRGAPGGVSGSGAGGSGNPGAAGAEAASGASGASSAGDPMSQMGQLMGMPMQIASQAAQIPMQALGALAAVPGAIMQGVQQVSQMTGTMGDPEEVADAVEEAKPAEEPQRDEAVPERPEAERAPVEQPRAQVDSPEPAPVPEKPQPAQTRPADSRSL